MSRKKSLLILSIFGFSLVIIGYIINIKSIERYHEYIQIQNEENGFIVNIFYGDKKQTIYPWLDTTTGIWEIFLPSYLNSTEEIKCYMDLNDLKISNIPHEDDVIVLKDRVIYELGEEEQYSFRINLSKNISTLFIETQSGTMSNVEQNKKNQESGDIWSINKDGDIEFSGGIESISGHGNASWECDKKPYSLKLRENGTLAGLKGTKNWKLLALYYEGDKIHSKLAFDLEKILGGEVTSECTWVDVYFNGHYNGVYLLIESIKERAEFQFKEDGFLLEKELEDRVEKEFFSTQQGEWFVVKNKGKSDLEGINSQIQTCENEIYKNIVNENVIDMKSFAIQFLINEISMNIDSFQTSSYYYKKDNDDKIYSGPCWDYDGAFAEYLHQGKNWVDPQGSIFSGGERLKWYELLYENPVFYDYMVNEFKTHCEEIDYLVNEKINEYAKYIEYAVKNDDLRWKFTEGKHFRAGTYQTWENDVRYLQYFLNKRLQYLSNIWNVNEQEFEWKSSEDVHVVNFWNDGKVIETIEIPDGESILTFPDIEGTEEKKWCFVYSGEEYYDVLPILEDCDLMKI